MIEFVLTEIDGNLKRSKQSLEQLAILSEEVIKFNEEVEQALIWLEDAMERFDAINEELKKEIEKETADDRE